MIKLMHKIKTVFNKHPEEEQVFEALEDIMEEREERGEEMLINPDELSLLKNLFKLRDIRANQIMIPRIDITGIELNADLAELKQLMIRDKFTRLPVYEKNLDNIVGIVHAKDMLCALFEGKSLDLKELMTTSVLFVPPAMRALDLLRELQEKRTQMAVVIDEFGGTDGLITLEDLLEEIVGEIEDEHDALDKSLTLERIGKDVIVADARVYVDELEKIIGPFMTPVERDEDVDTIGGLIFHAAGRLPNPGEVIKHPSGLKFQVLEVDARHIKKVKITNFAAIEIENQTAKKKKSK